MPKNDLVKGIDLQISQATFNGAGSTSGASGMEVHDLDGIWHTGTLPWADIDTAGSNLTDIATRAHSSLTGIGANDHHNQAHVLATNAALGADHTISGATSGHVLRASSATAAAFAAIQDADLPSTIVRTSRTITSGAGLTGGGDLSADRTLAIGAGDGITVNADDVALASSTAGAGLTFASGVLAVGAGLGITVNANDVALASSTAGAGLTYASGVLAVGAGLGLTVNADDVALTTPGTLTVATTNASTGSHTHAVTSSSNPGAAASILASTGSGGLTLKTLAVEGNVDITSGGDLTVGTFLYVDVSQRSVGIDGAPDPQFALDVFGPARAEFWIGPHALQIKNALLISHFDGRQPFETNFSGERNGHMGQVATVAGGTIWRDGKFNKAIQVAEATTNLVTNPSFETGTTGWTYNGGSAGSSAAQTALYSHSGTYSVRLSNDTAGENDFYYTNVTGLAASTTYTISAWCYVVSFTAGAVSNYGLLAYDTLDAGTGQSTTNTAVTDGWVRHSVTVTTTAAGGSHTIQIRLYAPYGYIAWDSVQCEAKAYATPYCDGSLGGFSAVGLADGTGHSWSGTAHASSSSRLAASASYPTAGNLPTLKGTVAAWVNLAGVSTSDMHILRATGTSAGFIMLRVTSAGLLQGYWGTGAVAYATPVSAETWTHVAMTYTGSLLTLYINGQSVASGSSTGFSGMPTLMYVGNTGGTGQINGLIDDLIITSDTKVADEILSIYESNAPVFAETAKYGFRATPKSLVWADDEGLWMRNTSGQAVFGIYGDDSTTKSWAGLTLASGDLVIGDSSRGGYVWWDDSAALLAIGRSGTNRITLTSAGVLAVNDSGGAAVFTFDASAGAEFTKPLTLGTSGGIYQGTGTFGTPTTGLKISNSSGVGTITGYNTGVAQWYGSTDGRLYAGAGEVALDSGGVKMVAGSSATPSGGSVRWYASSGDMTSGGAYPSSIHSYISGGINTLYVNAAGGSHTQKVVLRAYTGGAAISSITLTDDGASNAIAVVGATTFSSSTTVDASFTINDVGNSAYDFRAESYTEANMIFLDSSADTLYIGGTTNGVAIEKGGVFSFISGGTGSIKDGTNIPLGSTTGTKIGTATTQKLGFWNATPIVRPSAFTQTYATASKTHANLTYSAPATYGAGANGYSTAAMASAVHAAVIALAADVANVKQVLNSVIDDLQSMGLLA